ncbi:MULTISPECIES: RNA polymerase factor sigma-70 [Pseudomonas]|uniref:RNA polymerase factor sigma-70 n=1 Tax=Pseudomonas TaxID=286 RepID=UPI0023D86EC2|nr:RNA polymerase factor sigma-70 [Pseudomonas sp. PSE14]WEJ70169.1 RNA polymerase factor sigma-70 [Pseudomonas sp. PSE14]
MSKPMPAESRPALHELFATHRQTFINAAARILGCRSHAEDVVHDAYIKLNATDLTSGIQSQSGYLMRVVRNLAIDLYRRQALEKRYSGNEEEGMHVATPAASPETEHEGRQTLEAISNALLALPERTRYAFEMYRLHGRTQKEIAEELGVSPTLVNFMVRDALVHCRKTLKGLEEGRC